MAFSWFRLRISPFSTHSSGTMLVPVPPQNVPIFAVVVSSIRPWESLAIPLAAIAMLLIPFSGENPACAAFPCIFAENEARVGAA